jgi:perosamine synthetase
VGSLGTCGVFSFYGNKIISSGEGGAVTLSHERLFERMTLLRGQGADPERRYYFPIIGHNFRLTNVACAILCAQLERRGAFLEGRARIYSHYRDALSDIEGLSFQPEVSWGNAVPWIFPALIGDDFPLGRDELASSLLERGIETRPFFVPLHTLPPYRDAHIARRYELPVTMYLSQSGIQLPTFTEMLPSSVDRICDEIRAASKGGDR